LPAPFLPIASILIVAANNALIPELLPLSLAPLLLPSWLFAPLFPLEYFRFDCLPKNYRYCLPSGCHRQKPVAAHIS
jgi:hypothetical protein